MTFTLPAMALLAVLGTGHQAFPPAGPPPAPVWTSALAHSRQMTLEQRPITPVHSSSVRPGFGMNRIVLGALLGAAAGGAIGWVMTNDCRCQDPGYGVVLGIPLGALGGAAVGAVIR